VGNNSSAIHSNIEMILKHVLGKQLTGISTEWKCIRIRLLLVVFLVVDIKYGRYEKGIYCKSNYP
jgi:hypothetical protein